MNNFIFLVLLPILLFSQITMADTNKSSIFLECEIKSTINIKSGEYSETSGRYLIQVSSRNGVTSIKKEGLGAILKGKISESEIYGEVIYTIQNKPYFQSIRINRYTGAIEDVFSIGTDTSDGLMHQGTCKTAQKKF